jgi:hypothetical protein
MMELVVAGASLPVSKLVMAMYDKVSQWVRPATAP